MFFRIKAGNKEELSRHGGKPSVAYSASSGTGALGTQMNEAGSQDDQPLPIVILGLSGHPKAANDGHLKTGQ